MKYTLFLLLLLFLCITLICYNKDKFNDSDKTNLCYYYETINTTNNPILKNLDLTVVLTMKNNSNRFIKNNFILNLAPKTIFQINRGFKKCSKNNNGVNIDATWKDLNHAYITILEKYKDKYNNILILEDDAELLDSDLNKWKEIDNYLINPNFNILGIGNGGLLYPSISNFKKNMWAMGRGNVSQAIFYNMKKIKPLINKVKYNKYSKLQWDQYLINIKDNKTYRYPMIVQKFPLTDNSKNWNSSSSPMLKKFWDKCDRIFLETFGLDKDIKGWNKTYILWNYWYIMLFIVIMIITFIIIKCNK